MAASYAKLWKLLIDKNINKTNLRELSGISTGTLAKLGKNEYVSSEVLEKICIALKCQIGDIIEFV
jgi:DNA-binding Xre family transcriptional regulator